MPSEQRTSGSTATEERAYHGQAVEWGRQYDNAIHAELVASGEPVRLIQPANVEGMSPTFLCVRQGDNKSSNVQFVTLDQVRITDPNFLPTRMQR